MKRAIVLALGLVLSLTGSAFAANSALLFDGNNDYIRIPDSAYNDFSTAMTIEAWVKPINNHPSSWEVVVSKWCADPQWEMAFQLRTRYNYGDKVAFVATDRPDYRVAPAIYMIDLTSNFTAPDYQWTHLAAVFDVNQAYIYANGNLVGSAVSVPEGNGQINSGPQDLLIGAVNISPVGGDVEHFPGYIDEVRLWNVALTQQQIQDRMYYSLYGNEPGLTGYYNFDDGSGQVLTDLAHGINGRLGTTTETDNSDPQWVLSDGQYGQVREVIPEPSSLLLLGLGSLLFKRRKK